MQLADGCGPTASVAFFPLELRHQIIEFAC
jgi:hypothetical protein